MKKLLIALAVIGITTMLYSCSHNGYGCHGRSKSITRVKGNGYN